MKFTTLQSLALAAAGLSISFAAAAESADSERSATEYIARLQPMNISVTGLETSGEAHFAIDGNKLTITVTAEALPPGIMHLQHFHGFTDQRAARCPTEAADVNGDGIVDLIETEDAAGTTMVPFTADPASMTIVTDTYPMASAEGTYEYRQTVSLENLQNAFAEAFDDQDLNFNRRVVFIHGVLPAAGLPDSVASLGDIPAHVTLPIACGEIELVEN